MTQVERIVDTLRKGDKPNWYLSHVLRILNYTGRISDAREKGFDIKPYVKENDKPGTVWYHLERQ